jgi:hypothetical protein
MKRSRLSEGQIAFVLRQAEEETRVEEVCRKAGISPALRNLAPLTHPWMGFPSVRRCSLPHGTSSISFTDRLRISEALCRVGRSPIALSASCVSYFAIVHAR